MYAFKDVFLQDCSSNVCGFFLGFFFLSLFYVLNLA